MKGRRKDVSFGVYRKEETESRRARGTRREAELKRGKERRIERTGHSTGSRLAGCEGGGERRKGDRSKESERGEHLEGVVGSGGVGEGRGSVVVGVARRKQARLVWLVVRQN